MKELKQKWITAAGLEACVLWVNNSHHCGYVVVPKDLDGSHYDDHDVDVHGGLTYAGEVAELNNLHCVGFDCAHWMDKTRFNPEGTFRDVHFVVEQCELLAAQLVPKKQLT